MSRRWYVRARDFPITPTQWGNAITIDLTQLLPSASITTVRLRKAVIPYLPYVIIPDNQTIILTIAGVPYTIALPVGYYSGGDLMNAVQTALNSALVATTYSIAVSVSSTTWGVTITLTDSSIPGITPYTFDSTTLGGVSPSVAYMFGFANPIITSATGLEVSSGPLNSITDRLLLVTCDEAKGTFGRFHSLTPATTAPWHDGIISIVPIPSGVDVGDILSYLPEDDATWVTLVRGSTNGEITIRLSRSEYEMMGPAQINWEFELEIRP